MQKLRKTLIAACLTATVLLLPVIISCVRDTAPSAPAATPTSPSFPALSEQPDKLTFQKYFSDMGLGRLPSGGKLPFDLQKNVTIFTAGDDMRLYGTVVQEVQISVRYYNVETGQVIKGSDAPHPYPPGGFAGGETVTLPPGKYEYKVYVGDVLVAAFPFVVR